jgi:hypothetical protein
MEKLEQVMRDLEPYRTLLGYTRMSRPSLLSSG